MKKFVSILTGLALLVGAFILFTKPASSPQVNTQPAAKLSFSTVSDEVKKGSATLIDVRTAEEYAVGHFPGAINHSLQDMQAGKLPDVAKDKPLYVYCRSGNRSGQATTLLKQAGYTNITDLHGLLDVEAIGGKLTI